MKKLTAVEWLVKVIKDSIDAEDGSVSINWLHDGTFDKANKLFEEQIVDAYVECWMQDGGNGNHKTKEAEDYYNETFNQPES